MIRFRKSWSPARFPWLTIHLTIITGESVSAQKTTDGIKSSLMTADQIRFLKETLPTHTVAEATHAMNLRFGSDLKPSQIKSFLHKNKLKWTGRTGCFPKGNRPWNAGTKGQGLTGPNKGTFVKGNAPANRRPMFSERLGNDGYVEIKIPEKNPYTGHSTRFRQKHVYLWEQANGPVPDGMAVCFRDGDKRNFDMNNLMLISRAELLRLNKHGYKDAPDDLKPSILALTKMEAKMFSRRAETE
jgi:hypothetical protein